MSPDRAVRSRRGRVVLDLAVTVGLCAALAYMVDLHQVAAAIRRAHGWDFLVALTAQLLTFPLLTWRWRMMLAEDGAQARYGSLLQIYIESSFFGLFLPSAIGGDVFRGARIRAHMGGVRRTAVNILSERLIGIWALCVLAVSGLLVSGEVRTRVLVPVAITVGAVVVSALALASRQVQRLVNRLLGGLRLRRLAELHQLVFQQFHNYTARPGWLARLVALSVGLHLLTITSVYFVARAAGLELGFGFFAAVMPVVWLLSLLPSIGGVGPREGGLVYFLGAAGVARDTAVAAAVLLLGVMVVRGLLGGVAFLIRLLLQRGRGARGAAAAVEPGPVERLS